MLTEDVQWWIVYHGEGASFTCVVLMQLKVKNTIKKVNNNNNRGK